MSDIFKILVVDDEKEIIHTIQRLLRSSPYEIHGVQSGDAALEELSVNGYRTVILDLRLPDAEGLELLETLKTRHPDTDVLILTGFATVQDAVKATHMGAVDFIEKEYMKEQLPNRIAQLFRLWQLDRENSRLSEKIASESKSAVLIGNSPAMLALKETIQRVGRTPSSVLITGETGTGKELVARELHLRSPRSREQFVPVDCAAINDSTFESEMFGHVKGAFTGAQSAHQGLVRAADGGTLFFDEIGELPLPAQSKLLRTIQERQVRPVGGTKSIPVDVRIVAATNRDLEEEVREGNFREDLFYRLNVITLRVPPLRERGEDIALLFRFFLRQFSVEEQSPFIEDPVFTALMDYPWPGNVRELQNAANHAAAFAQGGRISIADLPEHLRRQDRSRETAIGHEGRVPEDVDGSVSLSMEDREKEAIREALEASEGNRQSAAEKLGISVATLYRKLKKYHLS